MAAGHDEEGWNRLGRDVMAAPGRRNGMVRLRMQAWSWRRMEKKREVFGEKAEECVRDN
jgi:hypothetical protein